MLKPIQHSLILALCGASPLLSYGAARSVDEAQEVGAEFFQSCEIDRLADKDALTLAHVVTDDGSFNPVCYVFNAKDGKGFVIVSADDTSMPVIGFSYESTWDVNSFPTSATAVLSAPVAPVYDQGRMARVSRAAQSTNKVLPTPEWSQEAPFNNNIPNRRLTGCVGVALAEILKYHNFPANRPASLNNGDSTTPYAWSSMRTDNYRTGYSADEANAVAALVADAAIGIGTDFGMSSSSAYEVKVPYALTSLFGYDAGVSYKKRSEIDKSSWDEVIVNEIDNNRPVLYSGQDVSAGHAFVCDGYKIEGTTYLHINWGWGGSANGFYASDALNPKVSKSHSYNDLMTIVYNIQPATNSLEWSPLHVTSDERQVGLTLNVDDISKGTFSVRAGALKNISNTDFSGKLAVALFDANGNQKALLSGESNFSLIALQIRNYVDFNNCALPSGTSVASGDVVRLVTKANGSDAWLPVAGDLLAPGEALAKGGSIPYFNITIPASDDVEITAEEWRVIKGRDYTFKVVPKAIDKVITVKANGFIVDRDNNNNCKLTNVLKDQNITVVVQNAAEVLSKSTLWLEAGKLQNMLTEEETASIKDLTLFGTMNAEDFAFIRERMKINRLDISQVNIVASGANPANALPKNAFRSYRSLQTIILPSNLTTFKNACLGDTGLTSIEIPASVGTWEYNVFANCTKLTEVIFRRSSAPWINWCVFTNTPQTKLVVPVGASGVFRTKDYWGDFKSIVEENPIAPSTYKVSMQEKKGISLSAKTEGTEFEPGSEFKFTVESDDTYGGSKMEVYANAERLYADSQGVYSTKINRNTLIHVEFKAPDPTSVDNIWKISGVDGGIGLVTDVVNVPVGQPFNVRVNTIKVPDGYSSKFFAMVLVDKNGGLKEVISTVLNNMIGEGGKSNNITYNFSCKVKESIVSEGDQIRLATAVSANANKRTWYLVNADAEGITDRINALGNMVPYHMVTLPENTEQYRIEGTSGEVVRGMPYSFKVVPTQNKYRVSVKVNGVDKVTNVATANVTIPAVTEDLTVTVSYKQLTEGEIAAENELKVVNVSAGQLQKNYTDAGSPKNVKLVGSLNETDLNYIWNARGNFVNVDMADVTVPSNTIPQGVFGHSMNGSNTGLQSIVLPRSVTTIGTYAFYKCTSLTTVVLPPNLTSIKTQAFNASTKLSNMTIDRATPPSCDYNCFPTQKFTVFVPEGKESAYQSAYAWKDKIIKTIELPKAYYHIDVDETRMPQYGSMDLSQIGLAEGGNVTVWFALPNVSKPAVVQKLNSHCRYGVAFKLYDNGVDMFEKYSQKSDYPDWVYEWAYHSGADGGVYKVYLNRSETSGPTAADNHKIELDFYYPISFSIGKGVEGVRGQIINLQPNVEWQNVNMAIFGGTGNQTLYKENSEIQFKINKPDTVSYSDLSVMVEQKIMTKSGLNPEYETQNVEIIPNDEGIYIISSIQGDTRINISLAEPEVSDGTVTTVEDILAEIEEGGAEEVTEVTLTGELDEDVFKQLAENFSSLEMLDLSGIENESIPDEAFAGMENLQTVTLPETVTEIGAGAFEGCKNIETLTLPGVVAIGDGAFEGCDNLTSILIPAAGTTPAHAPARVRAKLSEGTAITKESFRGLNPNCLIYVGKTNIPDTEELNIIISQNKSRVAASNIIINGNYPFNAPTGFDLGSHKISLTIDIPASENNSISNGWTGLMLPFTPTAMEYSIEIPEREGAGIHFMSFDDDNAELLTEQKVILPNRPYMANVCAPCESVAVTFMAQGNVKAATVAQEGTDSADDTVISMPVFDVPATPLPEEAVTKGKTFSLYGSFDGSTTLGTCYKLNEEKSAFVLPEANDSVKVRCFDAYLRANVSSAASELNVGEHPLWMFEPVVVSVNGTKVYRNGSIELSTKSIGGEIYYTLDGSDPSVANGTRMLYTGPFNMIGDNMKVNAITELKNNKSDIVKFEFELKKVDLSYNLAQSWNWISHNREESVAVADFAKDKVIRIISQTQEAVRDAKYGLIGNLKELNPAEAYKVCTSEATTASIKEGVAYDPTTVVKLHKGWNWIGCPVDDASLLVNDLFAALETEEGDMILGLDGFTQAYTDGSWVGTLEKLASGAGYMYYSNSDKEFVYNLVAANEEEKEAAKIQSDSPWVVDIHAYPSVMPVTAYLVNADGSEADAEEYAVAAFSGDECRGVGVCINGYVMINVHGVQGDEISFRFITPDNEEMLSETSVVFTEMPLGSLSAPYAISLDGTTVSVKSVLDNEFEVECEDGTIVINGDASNVESIEVYDLAGNKLAMSTNAGNGVKVSNLEPGVRIIVVRANGTCAFLKVMVK
ncbi:MAG: leucine-rich repeat protein [Bacteroides sp.]|nr:leucine-rich repeat protein [Bacteroides sp.]